MLIINFGGAENQQEIKIIKRYCQKEKLIFLKKTAEINKSENLQNEARIIRYDFFNEIINEEN